VLSRADARSLPAYRPLGVLMGEKPREWLVKGILAGEATKVELRLKGDLSAFPFVDPAQGEFSATARVRKGVLEYAPGWPRIEDIDAELSFQRNRMDIAGKSGSILGAALHDVKVSIPDLSPRAPRVLVSGQAHGATARFLQFLQASPLARVGAVARWSSSRAARRSRRSSGVSSMSGCGACSPAPRLTS